MHKYVTHGLINDRDGQLIVSREQKFVTGEHAINLKYLKSTS